MHKEIHLHFCERDKLARHLGIELLDVGAGRARARVKIQDFHLNGADRAHGGAIFTLADFAFAAASNSHGILAFSISATISIVKGVEPGATLTADAEELSLNPKIATYIVTVRDDAGDVVALFQGTVYRTSKKVSDVAGSGGAGAAGAANTGQ